MTSSFQLLSSAIPFPPVTWWQMAISSTSVLIDGHERYQKMSLRNRYYLAGPQGRQRMSIPLKKGRNQRIPVAEVCPDNTTNWQTKHWRTIQSLYGRAPFFEFFADELFTLFDPKGKEATSLDEWCRAGISLVAQLMGVPLRLQSTSGFRRQYPDDVLDIRFSFHQDGQTSGIPPTYRQVFQERTGFLPDCSILDLLCCQGPQAANLLKPNTAA